MYGLDEKTLRLIGSPIVEDVVLGFMRVKELYGKKHFDDLMSQRGNRKHDSVSDYLFTGIINKNHDRVLIKIVDFEVVIHLFSTQQLHYHTYRDEFPLMKAPKYSIFKVFEI